MTRSESYHVGLEVRSAFALVETFALAEPFALVDCSAVGLNNTLVVDLALYSYL
jgi:hypothetical protein